MFIFVQDKSRIVNTENALRIYVDGNIIKLSIYNTFGSADISFNSHKGTGNIDFHKQYLKLAIYKTENRAKEVLQQIFNAIKNNETTFEMPEN